MNFDKDIQLVYAAVFFCLLFLIAILELTTSPYYFFLVLACCGCAVVAARVSAHAAAPSPGSDATAAALLFYRECWELQEKNLAHLRGRVASLEGGLAGKTQEIIDLTTKADFLGAELETKTREAVTLSQRVAGLEASLEEARAREAQWSFAAGNTLPKADKIYRTLARKYHPDHDRDASAVDRASVMTDINMLWQAMKADTR